MLGMIICRASYEPFYASSTTQHTQINTQPPTSLFCVCRSLVALGGSWWPRFPDPLHVSFVQGRLRSTMIFRHESCALTGWGFLQYPCARCRAFHKYEFRRSGFV